MMCPSFAKEVSTVPPPKKGDKTEQLPFGSILDMALQRFFLSFG